MIRLGGLYRLESGAHNFWAKGGTFPSKPAGLINLVIVWLFFLAVQNSSIGDLVTHSLTESLSESHTL